MMRKFFVLFTVVGLTVGQQTANCIFEGEGTGEVVGEILLTETDTPDGTEIEYSHIIQKC